MILRPLSRALCCVAFALTPLTTSCGDDAEGSDVQEVLDTSPDTSDTTSDTTEPDTSPDTTGPDTADTTEPDTSPDTTEPDTSPDTTGPDTADTAEPDTTEPDTSPDTADTAEPDTTPTGCIIGGVTYAAETRDPANACATCVPATSATSWTPTAGTITLLDGALEYTAQGWALQSMEPFEATTVDGALRLATTTDSGATTSGMALLWRALPLPAGSAFTIEVDLSLERASAHNTFDAGAAILMAYTPAFGQGLERGQMIYLETNGIGWADNSGSAPLNLGDQAFRTFRVSIDAERSAQVAVDGVELMSRADVVNNGQIAIGDQTNDPNVDGAMRIRAVRLLCP